jgi:hypothetical protein
MRDGHQAVLKEFKPIKWLKIAVQHCVQVLRLVVVWLRLLLKLVLQCSASRIRRLCMHNVHGVTGSGALFHTPVLGC